MAQKLPHATGMATHTHTHTSKINKKGYQTLDLGPLWSDMTSSYLDDICKDMKFEGTLYNPIQSPKVTVNENVLLELRMQRGINQRHCSYRENHNEISLCIC